MEKKEEDFSRFGDRDLEVERQKTARELWQVRDPKDPRHGELETRYNEYAREQWKREGNDPADYKYKHDARHEFRFEHNEKTGEKRAGMAEKPDGSGPYTLRKRDEVINWREDTAVGHSKAVAAQQRVAGGTGDDAGHLIGAEFGADPADERNLARQELVQNEYGPYHQQERDIRDQVEGGRQCGMDVRARPAGKGSYRSLETFDVGADGKRLEKEAKNPEEQHQVLYGNFPNHSVRANQDGPAGKSAALEARQATHEHAAGVRAAVAAQKRDSGPPPREGPGSAPPPDRPEKNRGGR